MSHDAVEPEPDARERDALPGLRGARTLRPGSAVAVGVVGAVAGVALLVPSLMAPPHWTLASAVVLALVLLWLFVVRPCVTLHDEGVRLVNPLRTVDLTWPAITEVRSRWALELVAGPAKYTAWGVPADPGRPRHGRGMLSIGANKVTGRETESIEAPKKPKVEAQTVAAEIEQRRTADRRRKDGRTPTIASQSWDAVPVGLLLGSVALFVIAFVAS